MHPISMISHEGKTGDIARLDVDPFLACVYQVLQARIDYGQKSCSKSGSGSLPGKAVTPPASMAILIYKTARSFCFDARELIHFGSLVI
jgi:hypothetical protein